MGHLRRVHVLERQLRDLINSEPRKTELMADARLWAMLCASLDVLGDTELAIDAYLQDEDDGHPGAVYIAAYGVLQALFLQQDALSHIHEALGAAFVLDPILRQIRDLRNDAVGHPTRRGNGASFHMIVRPGMSRHGFRMYSYDAQGDASERQVDIPALLRGQEASVAASLTGLIGSMAQGAPDTTGS